MDLHAPSLLNIGWSKVNAGTGTVTSGRTGSEDSGLGPWGNRCGEGLDRFFCDLRNLSSERDDILALVIVGHFAFLLARVI